MSHVTSRPFLVVAMILMHPSQALSSRLTGGAVDRLFTAKVLQKYDIAYYRCRDTGFIQTETPFWLREAYRTPIADLDVGYVQRNLYMAGITETILQQCFNPTGRFVDYGGGYGMFVRLMRDRGFDFYRSDKYTPNLFVPYFECDQSEMRSHRAELLTAFEVFEHLTDPLEEIADMFSLADSILFSTELQPQRPLASPEDWWYFSPEHGQHIAFYTEKALRFIAQKFNARLLSNGSTLHILTRKTDIPNPLNSLPGFPENPRSLLQRDHAMIKGHLRDNLPCPEIERPLVPQP